MTNDKPPSREMCLRVAERCFDGTFMNSQKLGWYYLFCWAMYDHWLENYWDEP